MPDDQVIDEQVAEQTPAEIVDDAVDESAAFGGEDSEEVQEKQPEPEPEVQEPEEEPEPKEEETDEDVERGKAIIEQRQKQEAERQQREAEQQRTQDPDKYDYRKESLKQEQVEVLNSVIPKNLLPTGPIKMEDGTVLNFDDLTKEYPELPIYIGAHVDNIIRQLVDSGFLVGSQKYQSDIKSINDGMDQRMFLRTVTHPQYGVPEAAKIAASQEFKDWFASEKPEVQALGSSKDPWDHVRLLKRFQGKAVLSEAKQKAAEKDIERQEKKKNFDAIHKTTIKTKSNTRAQKSSLTPEAEELEAFTSKDDDDFV